MLSETEIKDIEKDADALVVQFKNILPRMHYDILHETATDCAKLCIEYGIKEIEKVLPSLTAERIKAKKLIEALEIVFKRDGYQFVKEAIDEYKR